MSTLKQTASRIEGLRYLLDSIPVASGIGREYLFASSWITHKDVLEKEFYRMELLLPMFASEKSSALEKINTKLAHIRDIRSSFSCLGECVLDDIQFFEIKFFSLLSAEISVCLQALSKDFLALGILNAYETDNFISDIIPPSCEEVLQILDPRKERLPSFFVYNEYDTQLASLRSQIAKRQDQEESAELQILRQEASEREDVVRAQLSNRLAPYKDILYKAMDSLAYLDVLLAKTQMAKQWNLHRPELQDECSLSYQALFYPPLKFFMEGKHKRYQSIDINLQRGACLLTGSNMSGKTVLMKTLALAQCMCQFGFFVPARSAKTYLFSDVVLLHKDDQAEERGLSSFGAEIVNLNAVLYRLQNQERILLLVDELARTTNPKEGRAIVCATIDFVHPFEGVFLLSTHLNPIDNPIRRLRIKGFHVPNSGLGEDFLPTIENLQDFMDYSLQEEDASAPPPAEALKIAEILGFHPQILRDAKKYL